MNGRWLMVKKTRGQAARMGVDAATTNSSGTHYSSGNRWTSPSSAGRAVVAMAIVATSEFGSPHGSREFIELKLRQLKTWSLSEAVQDCRRINLRRQRQGQ